MPEFNFKNLGQSIYSIRITLGISQKELAEGICSQSQISKIENGEISPYIHTLIKLSERLGVNSNYFINQISKEHYEFIVQTKDEIRKMIKEKDYKEVKRLINKLEKHPSFQNIEEKQFIYWHRGISDYYLNDDASNAIKILNNALKLKESIQATAQDIQIINSIGIIYGEMEDWENARNSFLNAADIFRKSLYPMDYKILVRINYNLSKVIFKLKENANALQVVNKGLNLAIENDSSYLFGELLYQKGLILNELGKINDSIRNLEQARTIFDLYGKDSYLKKVNEKISLFNESLNSSVFYKK
ncbi:helix-turn-helix transcriptional regulator [Mesobacillus subterraneus]|uniref:helix-turn-helix domain-containing protein n=1 Tax=Mesobacillus subterraneus TaxID=285983 RepID=UPI00203B6877|nr:helix-turn-helix domain-containing protein [Mesobacillus subterraneus]MCM3666371.1 helix-turn-helix transcriptional regulator [Mesobacillus subterraneus]MCM3685357.1 helix-turn-helix transcriptional regulator [Mesobacillus subterraneus]